MTTLTGSCHCGAITIEVPHKPRRITSCNCSICRRIGSLMAYYPETKVQLRHKRGAVHRYAWGDKSIDFLRCATCGCFVGWKARREPRGRMGVNMRNFDPVAIEGVRIRRFDGAKTWTFVD